MTDDEQYACGQRAAERDWLRMSVFEVQKRIGGCRDLRHYPYARGWLSVIEPKLAALATRAATVKT